jgi:hypothetical protein
MRAFESSVDLSRLMQVGDHNLLAENWDVAFRSASTQQAYISTINYFKQTKNWNSGQSIQEKLGML